MKKGRKFSDRISEGIDSIVGIFSPQRKLNRIRFRKLGNLLNNFSSYSGAGSSRVRSNWLPQGKSADQDLLPELKNLRAKSRDLNRNNPHASGVTNTMTTNVIGTGLRAQSKVDKEFLCLSDEDGSKLQRDIERAWKVWMTEADAGERMHFFDIQQLVDRQILENGEAIVLRKMIKKKNNKFAVKLQVIESDRLETPSGLKDTKNIRDGVELGDYGEPVAYYIRKNHPGDYQYKKYSRDKYVRIPAKDKSGRKNVIHLYHLLRAGQTRGVPFFAPVMNFFHDMQEYTETEMTAARVAACFSVFITNNLDDIEDEFRQSDFGTNSNGEIIESLSPGMIKRLPAGASIESFNPNRPADNFAPFIERMLRDMCAGLNLPYELVSKDFSKTNYSSARAALLEARRYFKIRQEWMSRQLCQPVFEMVIEEAYLMGMLPGIKKFYLNKVYYCNSLWIAPGWEWVDPYKEAKAAEVGLKTGIKTYADIYANNGQDWEEAFEQRKREKDKLNELGLDGVEDEDRQKQGNTDQSVNTSSTANANAGRN
ncbi:phage portal protein [bacterium]|nr:phage portal protein [bacterium]